MASSVCFTQNSQDSNRNGRGNRPALGHERQSRAEAGARSRAGLIREVRRELGTFEVMNELQIENREAR